MEANLLPWRQIEMFSYLACVMNLTIIKLPKQFLHVSLINKFHRRLVCMLPADPKEVVALWIPTDSLLRGKFIEHHYCVNSV